MFTVMMYGFNGKLATVQLFSAVVFTIHVVWIRKFSCVHFWSGLFIAKIARATAYERCQTSSQRSRSEF